VPLLEQSKTADEQVNADASTQNAPDDWSLVRGLPDKNRKQYRGVDQCLCPKRILRRSW
jgi:hypothetical protein